MQTIATRREDGPRTLAELVRSFATQAPERTALHFRDRAFSWGALDRESNRVAHALAAAGVRRGDRVALLDKDSDRTFAALFGIAKLGAVVLGVNWRLTAAEVHFLLEDSRAPVLLIGQEFLQRMAPALETLTTLRRVILLTGTQDGCEDWDSWLAPQPITDPGLEIDAESTAVQMYTSGTTGRPKGVMLAHRSFFAVVRSLRAHGDPWIGWSSSDVALHNIPAFHIGGLWWAVTAFSAGARLIVMDAFVAWHALELIARHRVTKMCAVPAMLQMMLSEPSFARADLRSLDHVVYGGSPIPTPLLQAAMQGFRCNFAQIYGLTETGNTAVCLRADDHRSARQELLKAAGRPYPGVQIQITDPSGRALGPRQVGEIRVHSPANMQGYWNRPEATAQTLADGWVLTGDAGYLDEEGYLYVSDRVKDMICYAGENVYPAEIESVLCEHPAIQEAAVIGVPDDRWGELVKGILVLRPGASAPVKELWAFLRPRLAEFKIPKTFDFVDALPRTPSGKIKKAELREPYWRGRERRVN